MSQSGAAWRATYTPGRWIVLGGPRSLVVLQPAPAKMSTLMNSLWDEVQAASDIAELVSRLASFGLDKMPHFAAFFWDEAGMHSLVRGRLVITDPTDGSTINTGDGVITWAEAGVPNKIARIDMEPVDQEQLLQLPLVTGAVSASAIVIDATATTTLSFPTSPELTALEGGREPEAAAASQAAPFVPVVVGEAAPVVEAEAPVIAAAPVTAPTVADGVDGIDDGLDPEISAAPTDLTGLVAEPAADEVHEFDDDPLAAPTSDFGAREAEPIDETIDHDAPEANATGQIPALDEAQAPVETSTEVDDPVDVLGDGESAVDDGSDAESGAEVAGAPSPAGPGVPPPPVPGAPIVPLPGAAIGGVPFPGGPAVGGQLPPAAPVGLGQAGQGQFGQPGQPQFGQPPQGQFGQAPQGQFGQAPQGQFGQAPQGQFGQAPQGQFGQGQPGQPGQPPQGQFGQPPQGQFGQPPQGQFGQPPQGQFGQPPQGQFGQPPQGQSPQGQFGQPPQGQFGQPPQGQFGQPPQGQFGQGQFGQGQFGQPGHQQSAPPPPAQPPQPAAQPWAPSSAAPVEDEHDGHTIFVTGLAATHKPAASGRSADEGLVLASMCAQGHPNPPGSQRCRLCPAPVDAHNPRLVNRPSLATLKASSGDVVDVIGPVLIGRAPSTTGQDSSAVTLKVPSPSSDISRTHVKVSPDEWNVMVTDLHSTNGTLVSHPGEQPVRLNAGESVTVNVGAVLDLGDGVTIEVAPPA